MSTENEVQEATTEEQVAAPEVVEEQVEETQVESAPDTGEDAAFMAGFDSANGIEPPPPEPEPEPQLIAGYTPEQIKELVSTVEALKQRESKLFGSMGGLKQTLETLKASQQAPAQTNSLGSLKFTKLAAEFPEIANILAEDLKEATVSTGSGVDKSEIENLKATIDQTQKAAEAKLLSFQHRDWRQVVASQDFVGWKESLPAEEKQELDSSWDSEFIGAKISEFKEWKEKSVQTKQTNQKRLEAAITPKGNAGGKPSLTETDAFMSGWKSVRG